MRGAVIVSLVLALGGGVVAAQTVSPQQVDQLFSAFTRPNSPGCALGVIQNGNFAYKNSYGEASLELSVPLSAQSVFYMGSVSKQFTAASIVLAAEQGHLSLDDDVRKYIPELPDYGHPVTLGQMLHQTSGFRDFLALEYLSGHDLADLSAPADILKLIVRQKKLNNPPGAEFIYSNTNYFLLGEVVHRATGQTLAQFAAAHIFQPLGMTHTRFYDDNTLVVPNRVAAYDPAENGGFSVDWSTTYNIVGGGGLMSTVDDLLLWDRNFYSNQLGNGTLVKELQTQGVLNDGNRISYAMGLFISNYRGLPTVEHGGALFGYRTEILRFPGQHFSVLTLCNLASADPGSLARKIADLYLGDQLKPIVPPAGGNFPDPAPFAGNYLDPRDQNIFTFTVNNGKLQAWGTTLQRISANQFYDLSTDVITFEKRNGVMHVTLDVGGERFFSGDKAPDLHWHEAELKPFVGRFHSTELDATYTVSLASGNLMLHIGDHPAVPLTPIAPNIFKAGSFGTAVFQRSRQAVTGLAFFQQSARDLEFRRLD